MKQADMKVGRAMNRNEGLGFEFQWTFALRPLPAESTAGSTPLADHTIAADVDEMRLSRVPG